MAMKPSQPINLFYCYSHADRELRKKLDAHLAPLRRQGLITTWSAQKILAGTFREQEIETQFNAAHIILLLVSPHFMQSDYCYNTMQRALEKHSAGSTRVIPVLLRPVDWANAPFSSLQMLPTNTIPVTEWSDRDKAFKDVAEDIRRVVTELPGLDVRPPGHSVITRKLSGSQIPRRNLIKLIGGGVALAAGVVGVARLWPIFFPPSTPPRTGKPASDPFAVFLSYDPSGYLGDVGDVTIAKEPGLVRFTYETKGQGPHEWDYKFNDDGTLNSNLCQFAGVMCLDPPNSWGTDPHGGYDLRGQHVIKWEARSLNGPVYVEFVVGGVIWNWNNDHKKVSVLYPDSMMRHSLGVKKLIEGWQPFERNLSDIPVPENDFRDVVAGFGWTIDWGSNGVQLNDAKTAPIQPMTFTIEIRNVYYER